MLILAFISIFIPLRMAFVPLDDRPASQQFPEAVAAICGARLESPPQAALGHFTTPGDAPAIVRWLDGLDGRGMSAAVMSADMLAYGGLVASRTPATPLGEAQLHLGALRRFAAAHRSTPAYVFGTVMRLAPTATPQSEPYLTALINYANLAGAPSLTAEQRAELAQSRSHIPDPVYWDYVGTRARDLRIDESLVEFAAAGDGVVALVQDDAGSDNGLQRAEEDRLHELAGRARIGPRTLLLNPGADEMGMVMVARASADATGVVPAISIGYSRDPVDERDPLEYLPIRDTIADLARFLGFRIVSDDAAADVWLRVVAPHTSPVAKDAFFVDLARRLRQGKPTALVDLSFVAGDPAEQRATVERMRAMGLLGAPIAFASWNTTANSAGTALSALMCDRVAAKRREDPRGPEAAFLFARYADDYAYRLLVRPRLAAAARERGADVFMLGDWAKVVEAEARAALWPEAASLFQDGFAHAWRDDRQTITLPWQRTFEVRLDSAVSPRS